MPVAAACLAATLLDSLVAVIHVTKSHGQAQAPTIARGMIEALLDLPLITARPTTLDSLTLSTAEGRIKAGEAIMARRHDEDDRDFFAAGRSSWREEKKTRERLRRQGIRPSSIEDKFKKTALPASLIPFYWHLCSSAHNDLHALAQRHYRNGRLVLGTTLWESEAVNLVLMCSLVAFQILEYVPVFLNVEAAALQETVDEIVTKLRPLAEGLKAG
jgi:hypothetical protein